jgi:uncharacterized protein
VTAGPATDVRWGMPDAALCFLAGFLGANVAVGLWQAFSGETGTTMGVTAAGLVGLWIGLVGGMVVVSRQKGSGSVATDFGLRFQRGRDLIGVPMGVVFQWPIIPLLYVPLLPFISDLGERLEEPAHELTEQAGRGAGVFVLAVLVVVGAPVVEELFYRGLLLHAVARRFGPRVAVVAQAALFAAAHFEPLQFPALFGLGLLLGVLTLRYDRLGPAIFAHAGFNAVTMAILIAQR